MPLERENIQNLPQIKNAIDLGLNVNSAKPWSILRKGLSFIASLPLMALSDQDYHKLNGFVINDEGDRDAKIRLAQEFRVKYEGDSVALQVIDIQDPSSTYQKKWEEYIKAQKLNNNELIKQLEDWFATNYPNIT